MEEKVQISMINSGEFRFDKIKQEFNVVSSLAAKNAEI